MRRLGGLLLILFTFAAFAANVDDDFLAAREAYRGGQAAKLDGYAKRLKGHLLEPYVAYWQLSPRLEQASAEEMRFFCRYRDTPVAERLRNDWVKPRRTRHGSVRARVPRSSGRPGITVIRCSRACA